MKKNFTVVLPDEPFKTSTALNNTIQCTYNGLRYVVARMENSSKKVLNAVAMFDSLDEFDLSSYVEDGHTFFVIDAASNPFEAALLTKIYDNGEINNYEETLSTGETWDFVYDNGTGAIEQIFMPFSLEYDLDTKTFSEPKRPTHPITRESFFESIQEFPAKIQKALEINDYTDEEKAKLENYKNWLENLPVTYADIDHWKIPFPSDLPPF